MVINSFVFFLFFVVVFLGYYLPPLSSRVGWQNCWLLLASYLFYSFADPMMLLLLVGATVILFFLGIWIGKLLDQGQGRVASSVTALGVCLGIGILLYFKYLGFFADSLAGLLRLAGFQASWTTLHIVLPVGVSFFTFKLISYIVEIRCRRIRPCTNLVDFSLYISFFPTIMSGPIDRPNTFLPQLREIRRFDYPLAVDGCRQILWGMFIKMCIADNLAELVDEAWADISGQSASALVLAALLYTVQIYTDFDGYSHMAIGIGKVLGLHITRNFNHPFIARSTAEVWRRWHMSLMNWFRDYVYIPLGGSRCARSKVILNTLIVFALSGLWHGADWSFVFWGLYHGCLVSAYILLGIKTKKDMAYVGQKLPTGVQFGQMVLTFGLMTLGWIFFRAPSIDDGWNYVMSVLSGQNGFRLGHMGMMIASRVDVILFVMLLLLVEWVKRNAEHPLQFGSRLLLKNSFARYAIYYLLAFLIVCYQGGGNTFIYFQF